MVEVVDVRDVVDGPFHVLCSVLVDKFVVDFPNSGLSFALLDWGLTGSCGIGDPDSDYFQLSFDGSVASFEFFGDFSDDFDNSSFFLDLCDPSSVEKISKRFEQECLSLDGYGWVE